MQNSDIRGFDYSSIRIILRYSISAHSLAVFEYSTTAHTL